MLAVTGGLRLRAARCRLLADKSADSPGAAESWKVIAQQWDRLAEAFETTLALQKRFEEISREARSKVRPTREEGRPRRGRPSKQARARKGEARKAARMTGP